MGRKIDIEHIVLITGGGGYLGSKLAERLIKSQCHIYLVDIRFNDIAISLSNDYANVRCKTLDLRNRSEVVKFCRKIRPHFIFHFASMIERNRDFTVYERLNEVNVGGTLNLLEALKDNDYLGFYFSSTSEVYGPWKEVPFHEDLPLHPMSPYSLTKVYCENLLQVFSEVYCKPYTIFRIFNFFGPGMPNSTFMGQMLESYKRGMVFEMTRGEQARDILFVEDLIDQILLVVESIPNETTFNLCSGKSLKMIEVASEFEKITSGTFRYRTGLPYRKNEVWETKGDNRRIRSLGFDSPIRPLGQMLKKCIVNEQQ